MEEKTSIKVNKHGEYVIKYDAVKVERKGDLLRFVIAGNGNDLFYTDWECILDDGQTFALTGLTGKLKIKLY